METSKNVLVQSALTAGIVTVGIVSLASTSFAMGQGQGQGQGISSEISAPLTELEKELLIYGQQEERLARDVYIAMGEKYNIAPFSHISESEEKHMNAIGRLLEKYNLGETTGYGELQSTYDALIAKGNLSLKDAIEVGIAVEILDIKDIDESLAKTTNEDIIRTYGKLRDGSLKHLAAYTAQLQNNGFTTDLDWEQYIDQTKVDEKKTMLAMTDEERKAFKAEKQAKNGGECEEEKGEHKGEKGEHKGENGEHKGQKGGNRMNADMTGMGDKGENSHKAKKGEKYEKFSGTKKERKTFKDAEKLKNPEAVYFLQERGIIKGYEDGEFKPEKGISRAESLKILIESTTTSTEEITRNPVSSFSDVDKNEWFAPYVEEAKRQGFVKGYADGTFKPNATVSQAELLKIAFNSFGIDLTNYPTDITEWYGVYLQYAIDNALLSEENIAPEKPMTREDFSEFIYKLILQQENL